MCGIVGAVAQRDVMPILLEGLKRLEYRGYDSAGAVVVNGRGLDRRRVLGKVAGLEQAIRNNPLAGHTGVAHTRWATHGAPSERNAHPHQCGDRVALVHNGIIENHEMFRAEQNRAGHVFSSETDTEVIVHKVYDELESGKDLLHAVQASISELHGAYAIGVVSRDEPQRLVAARRGSPLVIGIGVGEHFIASDVFALLPVTQRFIFLQEGDVADIRCELIQIYDADGKRVQRAETLSKLNADAADKAGYRHYMLKEIFTQPKAVADTLAGHIENGRVNPQSFGEHSAALFKQIKSVQIVACGTSFHAGAIARYWFEQIAGLPCAAEVASEFRYRKTVVSENCLFVTISQSGETADTLAALREAKKRGYARTLAICNVPESSLTREAEMVFLTNAGPEIGVASTKAFTTQLAALLLLVLNVARACGLDVAEEKRIVAQLETLPGKLNAALELNEKIQAWSEQFADKHHALYLGRGTMYPVAMEGALKLKEISYIHAEAYPAGELKHGPLALVDKDMPVIAVAPNNELLGKLKSNLEEVRARGGQLFVFADHGAAVTPASGYQVMKVAAVENEIAPIIYTVPLQLFSYHVAVIKGADIDQPRNLAKSVTVE